LKIFNNDEINPQKLINGNDLLNLGLKPGPLIKKWLEKVENLQLEGKLNNREEALKFIRGKEIMKMTIYTEKNSDSHVILYAKHHYKRTDVVEDLKRIYSLRNGIDPQYLNKRDILRCLLTLVEKFQDKKFENGYTLSGFLSDIDPHNVWRVNYSRDKEYDFEEACIYKCLSVISLSKVKNNDGTVLIPLDARDPDVLPLAKEE